MPYHLRATSLVFSFRKNGWKNSVFPGQLEGSKKYASPVEAMGK